jgi:uncharacterized protein involved in exopolysaccharide biosynthesis
MKSLTAYDYWQILNRRRGMVGLTMASAVVVALVASLLLPPVYEAQCDFYIIAESPNQLRSIGSLSAPTKTSSVSPILFQDLEKWYQGTLESVSVRSIVRELVPNKDLISLRRDVDIEYSRKHILSVRVRDGDPGVAAATANAYPAALTRFLLQIGERRERLLAESIDKTIKENDKQLEKLYERLRRLLLDARSPGLVNELQGFTARKAGLESEIASNSSKTEVIDKNIKMTMDALSEEARRTVTTQGTQLISTLQRLQNDIADIEADLAAARAEFDGPQGEQYPKVRELVARLAQRRQSLEHELEAVRSGDPVREPSSTYEQLRRELLNLYRDRLSTTATLAEKKAELAALSARADEMQVPTQREQDIRAEITSLEQARQGLRSRADDMVTENAAESAPVVILASAYPPTEAKFPLAVFNTLVAALLGLIAGAYVALAYDYVCRVRAAEAP